MSFVKLSAMAQFEVREVFRFPRRDQFVIAGTITQGTVNPGMNALIWLDGGALWSIPVVAIEFIDRFAAKESLVGLVCTERHPNDAETFQELCDIGTVIEVRESA